MKKLKVESKKAKKELALTVSNVRRLSGDALSAAVGGLEFTQDKPSN